MSENDNTRRETRRQKIKIKKRRRIISLAVIAAVFALLVFGAVELFGLIFKKEHPPAVNIGPSLPAVGDTVTPPPRYYDYSKSVPKETPVSDSYFNSVLFVGDVRIVGLGGYLPTGADLLGNERISVDRIPSFEFDFGDGTANLMDILSRKNYSAVYIQAGLNELGWNVADTFVDYYAQVVDAIRAIAPPDTAIYIQSIIPVTASRSSSSDHVTNERITDYNNRLKSLAEQKQVYYLNVAEALSGVTGSLEGRYAEANGISLSKDGNTAWVEYIKEHVVDEESYA